MERRDVLEQLHESLRSVEERYGAMSTEELRSPCTDSEVPGAGAWTPLDHLAHLIQIEIAFRDICRRALDGAERPIRIEGDSREEMLAWVHRWNQEYVESRRGASLEELLAELRTTRRETVAFVEGSSDDQLAQIVPGAPWGDGTVGGVIAASARHGEMHVGWMDEGSERARGTRA